MRDFLRIGACVTAIAIASVAQASDENSAGSEQPRDDIIVTGEHLRAEVASGKTDIPLIDTPQAISVISADDIKLRGVTRIADALFSVAGASRSSTYGFYDAYTLRGFDAAYGSLYIDGLMNEAGGGGSNNELFGLESVEVVKGPASSLFGGGSLGGIINMVSKRPVLDRAFAEVSLSTGSYDLIEGTVDANLPLDSEGKLAARITALHRDSKSFIRFAGYNRIFVQPSLTWQAGPDTRITVLGTLKRDHDNPWGPQPAYGFVFPLADGTFLPRDFAVSGGGDFKPIQNENRKSVTWFLDHAFTDSLKFSQNARYMRRTNFWDRWMFADNFIDDDVDEAGNLIPGTGRTIGRYYYGPYFERQRFFLIDNRLTWKVDTGGIRHSLLGGVDYRTLRSRYDGDADYDPTHFPLDAFDPDYFSPFMPESAPFSGNDKGSQRGFYIQDHIEIGDRATVTLNGRWDRVKSNGDIENAFSPRVGATFKVAEGVSLYGNWSRSFTPQFFFQIVTGLDGEGAPILETAPAERGENVEAGLKFDLPQARVSGTLAAYQLTRSNVAVADPDFPMFSRISGKQRSKGVEAEVHWRPAGGFALDLAYTWIKATYLEDSDYPTGMRLPNIPRHNLTLFGSYRVPDGPLKGLGATAGFVYNSARWTYDAFPYPGQDPLMVLKSYALVNGGLSYGFAGWEAQVNVNNILNKRYIPDACCLSRVTPGEPRNWRLTVRRSF